MIGNGESLEPEAKSALHGLPKGHNKLAMAIAYSQAVSLKRIADALTGQGEMPGTFNAIEQLAWSAGRSFEQGRRTDR